MYRQDRELEYIRLANKYSYCIPNDRIIGRYNGALVYIDTDNRMMYNSSGQAVLKFRH